MTSSRPTVQYVHQERPGLGVTSQSAGEAPSLLRYLAVAFLAGVTMFTDQELFPSD